VRQGKVSTPNFGEVQLDYDPDQLLVSGVLFDGVMYNGVDAVSRRQQQHVHRLLWPDCAAAARQCYVIQILQQLV
jgi:hypothetical protein